MRNSKLTIPTPRDSTRKIIAGFIKSCAEDHLDCIRQRENIHFDGFNRATVVKIDRMIENLRGAGDYDPTTEKMPLVNFFGPILGECVYRSFGGQWTYSQDFAHGGMYMTGCAIQYPHLIVNPFGRVSKQFENGVSDSIQKFYDFIEIAVTPEFIENWRKNVGNEKR